MSDKVKVEIDPRLLPLLGKSLYSMSPAKIVMRELFQNANDACLLAGVDPEITITVKRDGNGVTITCEDNGIGMTPEQLSEDFFTLGKRTAKLESLLAVGGFGIAKASILACPEWSVHTLSSKISSETWEIENAEPRVGTKISCTIKEWVGDSTMRDAVLMVLLSDSVGVTINVEVGYLGKVLTFRGDYFDQQSLEVSYPDDKISEMLHNLQQTLPDITLKHYVIKSATLQWDSGSPQLAGYSVFRLNGLVQFLARGSSVRNQMFFFDLDTELKPDDERYPFTMSRESLKQELRDVVSNYIRIRDTEILATQNLFEEKPQPKKDIYKDGYFIQGRRGAKKAILRQGGIVSSVNEDEIVVKLTEVFDGPTPDTVCLEDGKVLELACMEVTSEVGSGLDTGEVREVRKIRNRISMLIQDYSVSPSLYKEHAKILRAWEAVLQIVAGSDEFFGIGAVGTARIRARRAEHDGKVFYQVNPYCLEELPTPESKALALWSLACHEAAHAKFELHDESHSSMTETIAFETADDFGMNRTTIVKMLR